MIQEVLDFLDAEGIDIRKYPITFDSWYGSKKLVNILSDVGFVSILVHVKSNYVLTIGNKTRKLSGHKKTIQLQSEQWGCDKPVRRVRATSRTFGECLVLFFMDMGKMRTLLVFINRYAPMKHSRYGLTGLNIFGDSRNRVFTYLL